MIPLSDAAARIQGQEMFQILAKAKELEAQGRSILHFELGDPDFNIKGTGYECRQMADEMLYEASVAAVPGTIFGENGEGYLRFCYVSSVKNIENMLERLTGC